MNWTGQAQNFGGNCTNSFSIERHGIRDVKINIMTMKDFQTIVAELFSKANSVTDPNEAMVIVRDVKKFFSRYKQYLNPNALEDIGEVEEGFKNLIKSKTNYKGVRIFISSRSKLTSVIESMKDESRFDFNEN